VVIFLIAMTASDMDGANQIRPAKLLSIFPADAQPHEKGGHADAQPESGQIELVLPTEQASAKPINDADQRIQ
jgi:hypothetical protein